MSIAENQTEMAFCTRDPVGSSCRVSGIGASEPALGVGEGTR